MPATHVTAARLHEMLHRSLVIRGEILTQGPPVPRLRIYTFGRDPRYAGHISYAMQETNFQAAATAIKMGTRLPVNTEQRFAALQSIIQDWAHEERAFMTNKPIIILANPGKGPKTLLSPNDPHVISQLGRFSGTLACKLSESSWPPGPDRQIWRPILANIYARLDRLMMRLVGTTNP